MRSKATLAGLLIGPVNTIRKERQLVIDPATVNQAVMAVFYCALVPVGFAIVLIVRFTNKVVPKELIKPA